MASLGNGATVEQARSAGLAAGVSPYRPTANGNSFLKLLQTHNTSSPMWDNAFDHLGEITEKMLMEIHAVVPIGHPLGAYSFSANGNGIEIMTYGCNLPRACLKKPINPIAVYWRFSIRPNK